MTSKRASILVALLFAVGTLSACGSNSSPSSPSTIPTPPTGGGGGGGAADVTITITGMNDSQSFSPSPASVKVGQTVAWKNADSIVHTATADGGTFDTGNIAPGATSTPVMMSAAGTFGYHCRIHPSMVGSLSVQ
jgi:plastocyanin